ncbi:MAG: type 1 glutamine amidotransferase, partial [Pseudomonadota bacterium]
LNQRFDEYPEMFGKYFASADPTVTATGFAVVDGELPQAPDVCDAWLVTGSKYGVYDDVPWIEPLKQFLRDARAAGVPIIGICFGHQIMAEAFGGRAVKSDKGWGCGVHDYDVTQKPGWMAVEGGSFTMHAMHQDQVVALPDDATRLATSPFCKNAMVSYGDPEAPDAISIQPHPEFDRDFAEALVDLRGADLLTQPRVDAAKKSFGAPVDGANFLKWALAYLRRARVAA